MADSMSNHIVLAGLGRLGFRTFSMLRRIGENVVVIEHDEHAQFLEEVRRDGSPLFIGDARRESYLEEAGIQKAKSIVIATNDDLANLEIAATPQSDEDFDLVVSVVATEGENADQAIATETIQATVSPAPSSTPVAVSTIKRPISRWTTIQSTPRMAGGSARP